MNISNYCESFSYGLLRVYTVKLPASAWQWAQIVLGFASENLSQKHQCLTQFYINNSLKISRTNLQIIDHYNYQRIKKQLEFPLMPMGVLAPVSAQRDTPLSPPLTSAKNFWRTCLHSNLKTSPPTPKKTYAKFQNPKINFGDYHPPTMA